MSLACAARIQSFLLEEDRSPQDPDSLSTACLGNQQSSDPVSDIELVALKSSPFGSGQEFQEIIRTNTASFGIREGGAFINRDVTLSIFRSSLTMVIGKVGSGKSTLLKGLIGEVPPSSGSVIRSITTSAYCGQEPWLVNDTIQNNILGQSSLEARWYQTVINACALDKDFQDLPMGGLSVIGSKGISLSGGQKARVVSALLYNLEIGTDLKGACACYIF